MAFHSLEVVARAKADKARPLPFTARDAWFLRRRDMEKREVKSHPKVLRPRRWNLLGLFLKMAGFVLRWSGLMALARRTALNVARVELELHFPGLPPAFDGFRLLHVTDPHFDMVPEALPHLLAALPQGEVDAVVLTGDYRQSTRGPHRQILPALGEVVAAVRARDGVYATLGNHDTCAMVPDFEALGIRVLLNESVTLSRGDERITLTGLDDIHYYYTEQAPEALRRTGGGFKIALVHSNEFADEVASHGYALYLCGHTHGGQVCLPGGIPLLTHSDAPYRLSRGLWRVGEMWGYTSRGAGVVGLPIRAFCRGEITLITLRREEPVV